MVVAFAAMQSSTLTCGFSCDIPEIISLVFHLHRTRVLWVDHISTYYIFLSIARLVGFVTIELYPIPGVPPRLGPLSSSESYSFAHWIIS